MRFGAYVSDVEARYSAAIGLIDIVGSLGVGAVMARGGGIGFATLFTTLTAVLDGAPVSRG